MNIKIYIIENLKKQFGIDDFTFLDKYTFYIKGKKRVYIYNGCEDDIKAFHKGLYFGTIEKDGFRLSIEGAQLIARYAKKNIVEVNEKEARDFMKGFSIKRNIRGYVIIKYRNLILGCGKGNGKEVKSFIPKDRRIFE